MKIGVIGIGNITLELANRSARSGHEVLISNPRGTNILKELTCNMGSNVKLVSINEAATAELIILFLNREDLETILKKLPDMKGKVILHTNNPIFNLDMNFAQALSSSEVLASLLPDSHIVRLFNPLHSLKTSNNQNVDKTKIFFTAENYRIKKNVEIYLETLNFSGIELVELKN